MWTANARLIPVFDFQTRLLNLVSKTQVWRPPRLRFINLSLSLFVERGPRWALRFELNTQNFSKCGRLRHKLHVILVSFKIKHGFHWFSHLSPTLRKISKLWTLKCGLHASLEFFLSLDADFADFRVWIHSCIWISNTWPFSFRFLTKCRLHCSAILFQPLVQEVPLWARRWCWS